MSDEQNTPQTPSKASKVNAIMDEINQIKIKANTLLKSTNMVNISYEGVGILTFIDDIVNRARKVAELVLE